MPGHHLAPRVEQRPHKARYSSNRGIEVTRSRFGTELTAPTLPARQFPFGGVPQGAVRPRGSLNVLARAKWIAACAAASLIGALAALPAAQATPVAPLKGSTASFFLTGIAINGVSFMTGT